MSCRYLAALPHCGHQAEDAHIYVSERVRRPSWKQQTLSEATSTHVNAGFSTAMLLLTDVALEW